MCSVIEEKAAETLDQTSDIEAGEATDKEPDQEPEEMEVAVHHQVRYLSLSLSVISGMNPVRLTRLQMSLVSDLLIPPANQQSGYCNYRY